MRIEFISFQSPLIKVRIIEETSQRHASLNINLLPSLEELLEWFFEFFPLNASDGFKQSTIENTLVNYSLTLNGMLGITKVKSAIIQVGTGPPEFNKILWELAGHYVHKRIGIYPKILNRMAYVKPESEITVQNILLLSSRVSANDISIYPMAMILMGYKRQNNIKCRIRICIPESTEELVAALSDVKYDIIHFDLHGIRETISTSGIEINTGNVLFQFLFSNSEPFSISGLELANLVSSGTLCLFNSCWSDYCENGHKSPAQLLAEKDCEVISFKYALSYNDADEFYLLFYRHFFNTGAILESLKNANNLLHRTNHGTWSLYNKPMSIGWLNCSFYGQNRTYKFDVIPTVEKQNHSMNIVRVISRNEEFEQLSNEILSHQLICLHGGKGVGKSVMLYSLYEYWQGLYGMEISDFISDSKNIKDHALHEDLKYLFIDSGSTESSLESDFQLIEHLLLKGIVIIFTSYKYLNFGFKGKVGHYPLDGFTEIQFDEYLNKDFPDVSNFLKKANPLSRIRFYQFSMGNPAFIQLVCLCDYKKIIPNIIGLHPVYPIEFTLNNEYSQEPFRHKYMGEIELAMSSLKVVELLDLLRFVSFNGVVISPEKGVLLRETERDNILPIEFFIEKFDNKFIEEIHSIRFNENVTYLISPFLTVYLSRLVNSAKEERQILLKAANDTFQEYLFGESGLYNEKFPSHREYVAYGLAHRPTWILPQLLKGLALKHGHQSYPDTILIDVWICISITKNYELFVASYKTLNKKLFSDSFRARFIWYLSSALIYKIDPNPHFATFHAIRELYHQHNKNLQYFVGQIAPFITKFDLTYYADSIDQFVEDLHYKLFLSGCTFTEMNHKIKADLFDKLNLEGWELSILIFKLRVSMLSGNDNQSLNQTKRIISKLTFEQFDSNDSILETELLSVLVLFGLGRIDEAVNKIERIKSNTTYYLQKSHHVRTLVIESLIKIPVLPITESQGRLITAYWLTVNSRKYSLESNIVTFLVSLLHIRNRSYISAIKNFRIFSGKSGRLLNFKYHGYFILGKGFLEHGKYWQFMEVITCFAFRVQIDDHGKKILLFKCLYSVLSPRTILERVLGIESTLSARLLNRIHDFGKRHNVIFDENELIIKIFTVTPLM